MSTKPHFSLLATSFAGGPRPRNAALILSGLWLVIFFAALFSPPVLDDADATHAQAARAIATTGHVITLRVNGVRYLEKAPLPYWLTAISYRLFGFNTFATHLPQALAVLLLMLLGHRWANQAFGARTGFYTAIAVLTSTGVFLFTRILIPDVLLSLLLAMALFCFLKALGPIAAEPHPEAPVVADRPSGTEGWVPHSARLDRDERVPRPPAERPAEIFHAGPLYPYLMWGSLGFAVLAKGLVALVFFFVSTGLYLLLVGEWKTSLRKLRPFTGLLLFLIIAAPWHILAALHNPETPTHHGFLWFYFWNEHVLRFLGRRTPADFNKLPGWLYWSTHLIWLFPWSLFLPLGIVALARRFRHQTVTLTQNINLRPSFQGVVVVVVLALAALLTGADLVTSVLVVLTAYAMSLIAAQRRQTGFTASPFHRIDPQQRTILLLSVFAIVVLLFFSLSTNQEYYTFPAWLPVLLLIAATITRAEQTYSTSLEARRLIALAHGLFIGLGLVAAGTLLYGLWSSRHLPYNPDISTLLAHRSVGNYTLSLSHLFDLTSESFAALRFPAILAAITLAIGPGVAWVVRMQRRHVAATTTIAFSAAVFLIAAHIAFARFAPVLSSKAVADRILSLQSDGQIERGTQIALFGDQANGSSVPFYLGRNVLLVDGRSTSMVFGSQWADSAPTFLSASELAAGWGQGPRKILFVPPDLRPHPVLPHAVILFSSGGKLLFTDRPLRSAP